MGKKFTRPSNPIAGYTAKGKGSAEAMPMLRASVPLALALSPGWAWTHSNPSVSDSQGCDYRHKSPHPVMKVILIS